MSAGRLRRPLLLLALLAALGAAWALLRAGDSAAAALASVAQPAPRGPAGAPPAAPPERVAPPMAVRLATVADGFSDPLYVTHAGDGSGRLFVVEQGGRVRIVRGGEVAREPFLDLGDRLDTAFGERGLLGLAFAPDYPASGRLFVAHTARGEVRVVRLRAAPGGERADPASYTVVLAMDDPASNHNGGMVLFGPDGMLWVGTGDGGRSGDPWGNARNLGSLLGKLLRLDVSREPYAVPADNPFAGRPGARGEVWAYGLRNPWRFSFDRATGELWIGDVGQNAWEEIDREDPRRGGGVDYGWNRLEGAHCYPASRPCDAAGTALPVYAYGRADGCSVTGGYVVRDPALAALAGWYLFSDYCSGTVWALDAPAGGAPRLARLIEDAGAVSSFGEGPGGEIYLADHRRGVVRRLVPTAP